MIFSEMSYFSDSYVIKSMNQSVNQWVNMLAIGQRVI